MVCFEADYYGDITIGARTVIHPKARIIAEAGPIIIGEGNLIEEQAQIINRWETRPKNFHFHLVWFCQYGVFLKYFLVSLFIHVVSISTSERPMKFLISLEDSDLIIISLLIF